VFARLQPRNESVDARMSEGHVWSAEGRHDCLGVTSEPAGVVERENHDLHWLAASPDHNGLVARTGVVVCH
jgi:hypothetical protein